MRICALAFLFAGFICNSPFAEEKEATWLKVPDGFKVTHFADDDLATNIYSMTTDRLGRLVVAGPGYIKILLDDDGDGRADQAKLFSNLPRNGAMGMCFDGTDLICVGDQGILRFQDQNRDDVADGPPQVLLKLKTGGEHDSHAIRKGPDGWWYLVSGNYSGVGPNVISSSRSPVRNPVAGVITRISPDFQTREIYADGMRNTYDFDFDEHGDLFIYDSDGERDVSLPWYQPTRVFRLHPGSHAGWVTRSWKRPDYFIDMPTVAARLGRGSPTGVSCYRHYQFPKKYQNAMFVLDWTFGRVIAVRKKTGKESGATFENELFVSGKGTHGFAPTDVCVGVDGSLYISVGGRSTQGSVYRIRHLENSKSNAKIEKPTSLVDCLDLPQPQSSWSRFLAEPFAKKAGREQLEDALFNEGLALRHRVRAIEMITSQFGSISDKSLAKIGEINSPQIQARLAWSVCQRPINQIKSSVLFHFLNHKNDAVRIVAVESLTGNQNIPSYVAEPIAKCLQSSNLHLQKAAAAFVTSSRFDPLEYLKEDSKPATVPIALWIGKQSRKQTLNQSSLRFAIDLLQADASPDKQLNALRLFQISLGDVGPRQGLPQVYESYEPRNSLPQELIETSRKALSRLLSSSDQIVQYEAIRCLAMGKLVDASIAKEILALVNSETEPQFDIHILASIAQCKLEISSLLDDFAKTILNIQVKIDKQNLNQDRNWEPRFKEIVRRLIQLDNSLSATIAKTGITQSGQIFLFDFVDNDDKSDAIDRFIKSAQASDDFQIDSQTIRLLATTSNPRHWGIIRDSFEAPNVRDTVVELLSRKPYEGDREKYVTGLGSAQIKTIRISAQSLMRLSASKNPAEQVALLQAMQRISQDKEGYGAREWIVRVLQRNMERSFGFVFGSNGHQPQKSIVEQWQKLIAKEFPEEFAKSNSKTKFDFGEFSSKLFDVDWDSGDLDRGAKFYNTLSCGKCHGSRNRLGPDLAGVTKRFSKEDLFRAIADPGYQVPSRYQTTLFETEDGKYYSGIIIYDSVDGVLIRDSDNKTIRIETSEIVQRKKISRSLMPDDLLKELDNQGFADLYEYLKSL